MTFFLDCVPFSPPNHEVEPKEIQQPLVYALCSCPSDPAALIPGPFNSWQFNFYLILQDPYSPINSYFSVKEQASKTSEEGYIRYGSYTLFLSYFPSEKQYMDYITEKIIPVNPRFKNFGRISKGIGYRQDRYSV